ncbi:phosphoribosyltransferase-like protein [Microvirgula aerodenitrificans]|uniref:phosphoribosyltransferase-like protein n=1 Tax=Microvirgula aerodenitrificans TaxID=57480 RepID=UPI00248E355D|nr:hypothetical protein [Microvirgula aerodenitrificans]
MSKLPYDEILRVLVDHAWDQEVRWPHIEAWAKNFDGSALPLDEEQQYVMLTLSRFMYFGKRLVREMLKSLYRDHFKSVLMQRIRRNCGNTKDQALLQNLYKKELEGTRFLGVGNPSESGAHLLYYFRQVNYLGKKLFADVAASFSPQVDRTPGSLGYIYVPKEVGVSRYVFFDDMVGSGSQATQYLSPYLRNMRKLNANIDLRYLCLFATTEGLKRLNQPAMFDGNAACLFELDETYKCLEDGARYFLGAPAWFDLSLLRKIIDTYASRMSKHNPYGFSNCQLMLGFSHNTPDNTLPIFWYGEKDAQWDPVFLRYDKQYA